MEPLFDLRGRIVAIGTGVTTNTIVDGLLRLHAAKQFPRPITLYVVGGTEATTPLSGVEAMLLVQVMRVIRSPIRTVGIGLLQGWLPLLLACGTRGQRFLLPQTVLALGRLEWEGLPLTRAPIGLQPPPRTSAYHQTENLLQKQLRGLLAELKLPAILFATNRVWTAQMAIKHQLADRIVERMVDSELLPTTTSHPHEPEP